MRFKDDGRIENRCLGHQNICGYACCRFYDNFIGLLPGELNRAAAAGKNTDHLYSVNNNPLHVKCSRTCGPDDYKPLDCALYPLAPVTYDLSLWIRGDSRKCPIPSEELIQHLISSYYELTSIEQESPGSIEALVNSAREFRGYKPFGFSSVIKRGELFVEKISFLEKSIIIQLSKHIIPGR